MDFNEGAMLLYQFAHGAACGGIGRDRGADGYAAILGYLAGDETDASDVQIAMLPGETELTGKVLPDHVTVQERRGPPARLDEFGIHNLRQCRFAGAGKTGEKQRDTLPISRGAHLA